MNIKLLQGYGQHGEGFVQGFGLSESFTKDSVQGLESVKSEGFVV